MVLMVPAEDRQGSFLLLVLLFGCLSQQSLVLLLLLLLLSSLSYRLPLVQSAVPSM